MYCSSQFSAHFDHPTRDQKPVVQRNDNTVSVNQRIGHGDPKLRMVSTRCLTTALILSDEKKIRKHDAYHCPCDYFLYGLTFSFAFLLASDAPSVWSKSFGYWGWPCSCLPCSTRKCFLLPVAIQHAPERAIISRRFCRFVAKLNSRQRYLKSGLMIRTVCKLELLLTRRCNYHPT